MKLGACLVFACACWSVAAAQSAKRLDFEVASVKLSPSPISFTIEDSGGPESDTPGTWQCQFYSLRGLVGKAFAVDQSQVAGPSWLESQRFHIQAKLPPATTREQFREMLRNLLIDRFALDAHFESRAVVRYELVVANSGHKLRKAVERAAASDQAKAARQPTLDADGFPKLGAPSVEPEILTIQGRTRLFFPGSTVKDLAEELSTKLGKPVADMSGLTGLYDIGLHWSDNDDSGPSLPQAIRDQLGLRLVENKGPVDFVVVRHIEKLRAGN